jgi:hypothetical protein
LGIPEDCARNFPDDPAVSDTSELLRRIPSWHFFYDQNLGRVRPSSAAFEDDPDGDPMSVYQRQIIESEGGSAARVMAGHEGYALASLTAGQLRSKDQTVHPDPLPAESSHTKICGRKSKPVCRRLAAEAVWVIPPP